MIDKTNSSSESDHVEGADSAPKYDAPRIFDRGSLGDITLSAGAGLSDNLTGSPGGAGS